jgi:hypothetical protein
MQNLNIFILVQNLGVQMLQLKLCKLICERTKSQLTLKKKKKNSSFFLSILFV